MSASAKVRKSRVWLRVVLVALAIGLLVALFRIFPIDDWLEASLGWVRGLGPSGYVFFIGLYTIATVLNVPGSILTLGAGAAYGVFLGTALSTIGATLGATAAFVVGRYFARGWVSKQVAGSKRFAAVDEAVGKAGFRIVFMTRLSPVFPFVLLNYAFSLTKVKLRDYVIATFIGIVPGTLLYVYLGKVAADVSMGAQDDSARTIYTWIGLVVTVIVTVYVTRVARKALRDAEVPQ